MILPRQLNMIARSSSNFLNETREAVQRPVLLSDVQKRLIDVAKRCIHAFERYAICPICGLVVELVFGAVSAGDAVNGGLKDAEGAELVKLRFDLGEISLTPLGRVDPQGEDADAEVECPPLPYGVDGRVQVLDNIGIGFASTRKCTVKCGPGALKAVLRGCPGCSMQTLLEDLPMASRCK